MEEFLIASLVKTSSTVLKVKFMNVQQRNGYDCGVYIIANVKALAFGCFPTQEGYDSRQMRSHLKKCLEKTHFAISNA